MTEGQDVTPESLSVFGQRRRRGRPRSKDPSTPVRTRLPNTYYDKVAKIAHRNGVSMSAVIRQMVVLRLRDL